MATQAPSTPVKVPSAAANYTPATMDSDLRSQINSILIKEGHVSKIQESLLHSLHAHSSNWPTAVQAHALSLLRSGEVTNFPALVRRVIEDVRQDTAMAPSANANGKTTNGADENGGGAVVNGVKKNGANGAAKDDRPSLAVPQSVVEDALRVTREALEEVCAMDESEAT